MNWYKKSQQNNEEEKFEYGKIVQFPFEEGSPNQNKIEEMEKWIKLNKDIYNPSYIKLYHATNPSIPVLEEGLKPTSLNRRRSYQSSSGYVYLANTPERAKVFGDLANQGRSIVYEITIPVHKLKPDKDQLNNLRATGREIGNSLAESIIYGGGVAHKGKIEPYYITLYSMN